MGDIKLLPRYIISMGLCAGLKTFTKVELLDANTVYVAGLAAPLHLRPGTSDRNVFREVFLFKDYDFKVNDSPTIIIDAGANIGLSSVFFTQKFRKAIIYAVEPEDENFKILIQNVSSCKMITPVQSAVWSNPAALKIKNKDAPAWAFEIVESDVPSSETFNAISIESLMKTYQFDRIDILKLDIEGSEKEIFSLNYQYWLPRTKIIIIELHDWMKEGCSRSFFRAISKYRFQTSVHNGMLLLTNLDIN